VQFLADPQAPQPAELTLQRLLGGMAEQAFFDAHWGRQPLRIQRGDPGFYRNLFTLRDVDTLLFTSRFRPGEYRVAESAEGIDLQWRNTEDPDATPPISEFYRQFNAGKSLVLHGLNLRWPAMDIVTRLLTSALACAVTTNVYLTPAGAQAYPLHYDTHDFFVLQLHGRKRWRLYEAKQRIKPIRELVPLASDVFEPGDLIESFDVEAGDLLYVPRGHPHDAVSSDGTSLHLTIGLHGMTWYELMTKSLAGLAAASEPLRTFVPLQPTDCGPSRHDLSDGEAMKRLLSEGLDLNAGDALWKQGFVAAADPAPDGQWLSLEQVGGLTGETMLQRRFGVPNEVMTRDNAVELHFLQDKVVRAANAGDAIRHVLTHERFTVASLPGLAPDEARALASELVLKGFLKLAAFDEPNSHPMTKGFPMIAQTPGGETLLSPMSQSSAEAPSDSAATPAGGCGCGATPGAVPPPPPSFVYAIGRIAARFPSIDIEKELQQAARQSETANLTDSQVLYQVLSRPENAYLAREMCWVFTVQGVETFTVMPRSGAELAELIGALQLTPSANATNVLIGMRTGSAIANSCAGLTLPVVSASKIYSFNLDEFVKELPTGKGQASTGQELLERVTHLVDNVGDMDEHRAVNYLCLRHLPIYALVVEKFKNDYSLQGLGVTPSATRSQRRLIDVTLRFASRKTDVSESYGARVDVTGMYPFLVHPLRPVFDKDS
jgi:ribosomal protein L16 Arg81 hydroxylase